MDVKFALVVGPDAKLALVYVVKSHYDRGSVIRYVAVSDQWRLLIGPSQARRPVLFRTQGLGRQGPRLYMLAP